MVKLRHAHSPSGLLHGRSSFFPRLVRADLGRRDRLLSSVATALVSADAQRDVLGLARGLAHRDVRVRPRMVRRLFL